MTVTKLHALHVVVFAISCQYAAGQISSVLQERRVQTQVTVSSGGSNGDFAESMDFGPFLRSLSSIVLGAGGSSADASAAQDSTLTSGGVSGFLSAGSVVRTGSTFVTGEGDGTSSFLYIFNLAAPTAIQFRAEGNLSYIGRDPNGEPSDLFGTASVRLLDGITMDLIAGFTLFSDPGFDSASFDGTLPSGQYVILASARLHAFSADLLGPPARSGSGVADASFSLNVIPSPGVSALLGMGVLAMARRRR